MNEGKYSFDPDYAVPPGETLQEVLESLNLTQKELALRMGRPLKTINEIIKGVASITAETALQLEKVTGLDALFWSNAEAKYRQRLARNDERRKLNQVKEWLDIFSLKKMVQLGFIESTKTPVDSVDELLRFFGVASVKQWQTQYGKEGLSGLPRLAGKFKNETGDLSVWLRGGEILGYRCECNSYDRHRFLGALARIRELSQKPVESVWEEVCQLCAEAGVVVAVVPELPGTHVNGFTRWLTPKKALIQLSFRYKRNDAVWFTFFHEAAHLLLHGKKECFVETNETESPKEIEANTWARDFLIPQKRWDEFVDQQKRPVSKESIVSFAEAVEISVGVVVGRLQYEKRVPQNQFNDLKEAVALSWAGLCQRSGLESGQ